MPSLTPLPGGKDKFKIILLSDVSDCGTEFSGDTAIGESPNGLRSNGPNMAPNSHSLLMSSSIASGNSFMVTWKHSLMNHTLEADSEAKLQEINSFLVMETFSQVPHCRHVYGCSDGDPTSFEVWQTRRLYQGMQLNATLHLGTIFHGNPGPGVKLLGPRIKAEGIITYRLYHPWMGLAFVQQPLIFLFLHIPTGLAPC